MFTQPNYLAPHLTSRTPVVNRSHGKHDNHRQPTVKAARPSMADVARHAGVSPQTVSRVSNGHSNVDAATKEKVVESMHALGYRPNGAARALKSGHFNTSRLSATCALWTPSPKKRRTPTSR
jgi:hypothetical protein